MPSSTCRGSRLSDVSMTRPSSRLPYGVRRRGAEPCGAGTAEGLPCAAASASPMLVPVPAPYWSQCQPHIGPSASPMLVPVPAPCWSQCHPHCNPIAIPTPFPYWSQCHPHAGPIAVPTPSPYRSHSHPLSAPDSRPAPFPAPPHTRPTSPHSFHWGPLPIDAHSASWRAPPIGASRGYRGPMEGAHKCSIKALWRAPHLPRRDPI